MKASTQPSASRSSLISGSAFVGVTILNYCYALAMAWLLPVESYGVLGLTQSWILIAATLMGSGFPWDVARIVANGDSTEEAYAATKSALAGNLGLAVAFSLLLLLLVRVADLSFGPERPLILTLIVVESLVLAGTSVYSGVLQGTFRFGAAGLSRIIEAAIKLALGIGLVTTGYGAAGAVGATVVATVLTLAYIVWSVRGFQFWRSRRWSGWELFRGSLTIFLGLSALTMIMNVDIIGIDLYFSGTEAVVQAGYYQAASMLPRMLVLLARIYAAALFPYIARADERQVQDYAGGALKYIVLLVVAANLVMAAIPEAILGLIFPDSYVVAAPAMRYAALGSAVLSVATVVAFFFQARNLKWPPAIILPLAAAVELLALMVLLPRFGIVGAGLSLLVAGVVACVALFACFVRTFGWRLRWSDALRFAVAGATLVAVLVLLPRGGDVWTVLTVLIGLASYVVALALVRLLRPADVRILSGGVSLERLGRAAVLYSMCVQTIERLNRVVPQSRYS